MEINLKEFLSKKKTKLILLFIFVFFLGLMLGLMIK